MEEIEVTYTLGDMYAVTLQSWQRLLLRIAILFGLLIAVLLILPVLMDGDSFHNSVQWFPWGLYLGLISFALVFLFGVAPSISYYRTKRRGFLGPNRHRMTNVGVQVDGSKGESLIYWSAVTRLIATNARLFLFVGPTNALILPKRAFASPGGFSDMVAVARAHWEAAKAK